MNRRDEIDPLKIGIRCQDIQTSVQDVDLGALAAETKNIRLLGMAERLAIHIRGTDVIDDYKKLEYVSTQFGIEPIMLSNVLGVLSEVAWVRVRKKGSKILGVEESVPYFKDIYSEIGQYYKDTRRSEIEDAAIAVTDTLALCPIGEEDLKKKLGLESRLFKLVLDVGRSGKFIGDYESHEADERILYSPLYWVENPEKVDAMYRLLKQYGAESLLNAFGKIREYQGYPLSDGLFKGGKGALSAEDEILFELIKRGVLLAPKVNSLRGEKNFAFTPYVGIPIEEKVILEKAMAVLACIRYGEHFGLITKIKYPDIILDRLLQAPHTIGSHSEIRKQYAILVVRGIGKVFPDKTDSERWYFQLIDKEENIKAIKLAKDLLLIGEAVSGKGMEEKLQSVLLCSGSYEESLRILPKLRKPAEFSRETQDHILNEVLDLARGGKL